MDFLMPASNYHYIFTLNYTLPKRLWCSTVWQSDKFELTSHRNHGLLTILCWIIITTAANENKTYVMYFSSETLKIIILVFNFGTK